MNDDETPATVSLAISEMRRSLDVGLAKIDGQLGLLLQRADQTDRRADEHGKRLEAIEGRLRGLEQDGVTEADLGRLEKRVRVVEQSGVTKAEMDGRTKKIIAFLSLVIAAVGTGGTLLALFIH